MNIVSAWQLTKTSDDDDNGKTVEPELEGEAIIKASVVSMPPNLPGEDNNATAKCNLYIMACINEDSNAK